MTEPGASTGSSVLDEIAQVIGEEATAKLVRAFGGIELYIPAKAGHAHPLTAAIGGEATAKLVDHYHGTELSLPRIDERRVRVHALAKSGRLTKKAIARETGYTERHVYHMLAQAREEDDQPDLFT